VLLDAPVSLFFAYDGLHLQYDERHPTSERVKRTGTEGSGMKVSTVVGIILVVIGVIGFALGGISFTHEKKDVDIGPLQVSHKQTKTVPISPILSTVAVVVGAGLIVVGARSKGSAS